MGIVGGVVGSIFIAVLAALFIVLPIIAAVVILRWIIAGGVRDGMGGARQDEDPLVILQRRYARGEIDETEYERRRQALGR